MGAPQEPRLKDRGWELERTKISLGSILPLRQGDILNLYRYRGGSVLVFPGTFPAPTCHLNRASSCSLFSTSGISASTQLRDTHEFCLLLMLVSLGSLSAHCQSVFLYFIFKILQETASDWPGLVTDSHRRCSGQRLSCWTRHQSVHFLSGLVPSQGLGGCSPADKCGFAAPDRFLPPDCKTKCEKEKDKIVCSSTTT